MINIGNLIWYILILLFYLKFLNDKLQYVNIIELLFIFLLKSSNLIKNIAILAARLFNLQQLIFFNKNK